MWLAQVLWGQVQPEQLESQAGRHFPHGEGAAAGL